MRSTLSVVDFDKISHGNAINTVQRQQIICALFFARAIIFEKENDCKFNLLTIGEKLSIDLLIYWRKCKYYLTTWLAHIDNNLSSFLYKDFLNNETFQ